MITLMFRNKTILLSIISLILSTFTVAWAADTPSESNKKATGYQISSVKWEQTAEEFLLRISGGSAPTYTMYELFDPLRVVIDVADASLNNSVKLPLDIPHGPVSLVNGQVLEDKEPFIARLEIFLNSDNTYTVDRQNNDIVVKFPKEIEQKTAATPPIQESVPATDNATELYSIDVEKTPAETRVHLKANGPINDFKKVALEKNSEANRPDRIYIDLENIKIKGNIPDMDVNTTLAQIRTARRDDGVRVVFDSSVDELFKYSFKPQSDGLLMTIVESGDYATQIAAAGKNADSEAVASESAPSSEAADVIATLQKEDKIEASDESQLLETKVIEPKKATKAKKKSTEPIQDDFAFAGYKKQRISVDFYKIDLHNVFRLIGEISNLNIVVSEEVSGSLTLSLNDVPWDFALDIVMNLKDLQKEERFNTIVISPKSKNFTWPERTLDNIAFKEDKDIKEKDPEALTVKQVEQVPETVVQAKKLIYQAQILERQGSYKDALPIYEEAFNKWPDNFQLANQMAALCLVQLEMNAKAIHYAKAALKINPDSSEAALHGAIALARMQKPIEAIIYFDKAVSGAQPSSEALSSYAAFNEENDRFDDALMLLKRHEELFGDTLQTMISKARIYDKQGNGGQAADEYRAIMLSGFEIPMDLKRYIKGRISLASD